MLELLEHNKSYPCISHALKIPGGATMTVFMTEDFVGKLIKVDAFIGKTGSDISAASNAISKLITALIQFSSLDEVIAILSDIATDRVIMVGKNTCRSMPEAFAIALRDYRELKAGV